MATVFLLENPTHYVNAAEYIFQQDKSGENLYLLEITQYHDQILAVDAKLGPLDWTNRVVYQYNPEVMDPASIAAKREAFRFGSEFLKTISFDSIVVGNIGSDLLYALTLIFGRDKTIVALDDGAPTLDQMAVRKNRKDFIKWHVGSLKRLTKAVLAYRFFLPFYRPIKQLTFFSTYSSELGPRDHLIPNQQSLLSQLASKVKLNADLAWFIGSSWVEKGIISEETLIETLSKIIENDKEFNFKYVAHRNENLDKLRRISQICEVKHFQVPIEIAICTTETSPTRVYSIYTSALPNISSIGISIRTIAIRLKRKDILVSSPEPPEYIASFYEHLEQKGVKVLPNPMNL